jgi:hypothetical protein
MEEISEQHSVLDEISDAISNPFGLQMDDEEDLLAELEQLQKVTFVSAYNISFFRKILSRSRTCWLSFQMCHRIRCTILARTTS